MKLRRYFHAVVALVTLTAIVVTTSAHVGSPDAWFEGNAGPYPVIVNVQMPGVVPGVADVYVRVATPGITQVAATVTRFDATGGAPPPEIAKPVVGDPGLYHTKLWMMTSGSNSVTAIVTGPAGEGSAVVPVVVAANERLGFGADLGVPLAAVGLFLFFGAISIVGSAVRESGLPPGESPEPPRRRKARVAMVVASGVVMLLLFGGWKWWSVEDARFVRTLYVPTASQASTRLEDEQVWLDLVITDRLWRHRNDPSRGRDWRNASRLAPLVTDHGKLMHLFLVRDGDLGAIAHLHPVTTDSVTFSTPLPMLPAGRYRVLADVVRESGHTETMVAMVNVPAAVVSPRTAARAGRLDADDSWYVGAAQGDVMTLADGSTLRWERGSARLMRGQPAPLRFVVSGPNGTPARLEPYMGMGAHAAVLRDDGTVFIHLHPSGTVSMAAQATFEVRKPTDTLPGMLAKRLQSGHGAMPGMSAMHASMPSMQHATALSDTIRFPYAFPQSGRYRIWVQVKREGRILTGAFDATVADTTK